jgi:hypothetical protein
MKLKTLKHFTKNNKFTDAKLKTAAEVINFMANSEDIDEEYRNSMLSMVSDIYGYLEIKKLMSDGMSEQDAINSFSKRVIKIFNV